MNIYERLFTSAEKAYLRALELFNEGRLRRASATASIAAGAALFVELDKESPEELRERAIAFSKTIESFLGDVWQAQSPEYGERFLSGAKNPFRNGIKDTFDEFRQIVEEVNEMR